MLDSVLKIKYKSSSIFTEYDNSMIQLNQAKSSPGSGIFIIGFGIKSPRGDIQDVILQNKKIHRRSEL